MARRSRAKIRFRFENDFDVLEAELEWISIDEAKGNAELEGIEWDRESGTMPTENANPPARRVWSIRIRSVVVLAVVGLLVNVVGVLIGA